jgi:prophage regulatory protein
MQAIAPRKKFIRLPALKKRVPVDPVTIWRWERQGRFPKRIKIGPNSVGWDDDEIDAWSADPAAWFAAHAKDDRGAR